METAVAVGMLVMGLGIAGVWTKDILGSEHVDLGNGLFAARDPESGSLFWPHWTAEFATAAGLVIGAVGLLADASWAPTVAGIAAGALLYTSLNSLGWALAETARRPYAMPMAVGIVVAVITISYVLRA